MRLPLLIVVTLATAATFAAPVDAAPASATQVLALATPSEDDGASACAFVQGGTHLLITHSTTGSVTRMRLDTGEVVERLDIGGSPQRMLDDDPSGRAVVLDDSTDRLHVLQASPLQLLRTVDLAGSNWLALEMAQGADDVMVVNSNQIVFVDLATGVVQHTVPRLPFGGVEQFGGASNVVLSPDGQSVVRAVGSAGAYLLERVDIASGAVLASAPIDLVDPSTPIPSPDRTSFALISAGADVQRFDTLTLAMTGERTTPGPGPVPDSRLFVRAFTGDRIVISGNAMDHSVPFDAALPIVSRPVQLLGGTVGIGNSVIAVTGFANSGLMNLETLECEFIDFGPIGFVSSAGAVLAGSDRFAFLNSARVDALDLVDASPNGPIRLLSSVPTGFGDEIDGHYQAVDSPLSGRTLIMAEGSSSLVEIATSAPAAITRCTRLPGPPVAHAPAVVSGEERCLIGTATGHIAVVDPSTLEVVTTIVVGATVLEIDPLPGQDRAWVRVASSPDPNGGSDQLILVDVGPNSGSSGGAILSRVLLSGQMRWRAFAAAPWRETVVIDAARQRAYAVHDFEGEIDVVDLATAGVVVSIHPLGPHTQSPLYDNFSLDLSQDGKFLLRTSEVPVVFGIDVESATPSILWGQTYGTQQQRFGRGFRAEINHDASAVITVLRSVNDTGGVFGPGLVALDLATGDIIDAVDMGAADFELTDAGEVIVLGSMLHTFRFEGGSFTELGSVDASLFGTGSLIFPGSLHVDRQTGAATILEPVRLPFHPSQSQAVIVDAFEGRVEEHCTGGTPGLLGTPSRLNVGGSSFAGGTLRLQASNLIAGALCLAAVADATTAPRPIAGSLGRLCLGGSVGRLNDQIGSASAAGTIDFRVDTLAIPLSSGVLAIAAPGSSWTFQAWHRDLTATGTPTTNTSNAIRVEFR